MNPVLADISFDGLVLNGHLFRTPMEPSEYVVAVGAAARVVEPMTPAPYGYRNNQIHLFDDLGLYLIEDHATRLVDAVAFVLWLEESAFAPAREFSGILTVGGVRFLPGTGPRDYRDGGIAFEGPVLGLWSARKDQIWIGLSGKGVRLGSGRRGRQIRFVNVGVCFSSVSEIGKQSAATGSVP